MDLVTLVQLVLAVLTALVGLPAFIAVLILVLQRFGVNVNPDQFTFWANVIAFVGIFVAALTGNLPIVDTIDLGLGALAKVLADILILLPLALHSISQTKHYHTNFTAVRAGMK